VVDSDGTLFLVQLTKSHAMVDLSVDALKENIKRKDRIKEKYK
jgi:hypothetical protein